MKTSLAFGTTLKKSFSMEVNSIYIIIINTNDYINVWYDLSLLFILY